jgi:prenyl protein peptidase
VEKLRSGDSLAKALLTTLVQAAYTSIFGAIAVILFLRTGTVWAPIASHIYCNYQGLPDIAFMHPACEHPTLHRHRAALLSLHVVGLILFSLCLYPLTEGFEHYSIQF